MPSSEINNLEPAGVGFFVRHKKLLWTLLLGACLIIAALLVYILYFRDSSNNAGYAGDASLVIEAPAVSASGSEISYEIVVENLSDIKLTALELEVFYPLGFTFLDSTPDSLELGGSRFVLEPLASQEERTVVIVGTLEGSLSEIKVIGAKLHYVPENFRSSFVAQAQATTEMMAPALAFRLVALPHLVTGQKISYEMQIRNISSRPFAAIVVKIDYPEKFTFQEASPLPVKGTTNQWELLDIGVGEMRTIKASGLITESPGKEAFASAELQVRDSSGATSSAGRSFAFTQILNSPLKLGHSLKKTTNVVLPGEELRYEITYQNVSSIGLNNVVISVVFDTAAVDFFKLNSPNGQLLGKTIVWIPAAVPELLVVGPGESGKFDFRIPVQQPALLSPEKNPTIPTRVQFRSKEFPEEIVGFELEVKVESQLEVEAQATALGSGQYRIDLEVGNGVNDAAQAVLTATVPSASAVFLSDTIMPLEERDHTQFIPDAGIVRWDLESVFAYAGSFHEARRLSFVLSLTGSAGEIGPAQAVTLLQNIQAEAVDEFTGNKISSKKIESLTTH